jgi:hypothetical protein
MQLKSLDGKKKLITSISGTGYIEMTYFSTFSSKRHIPWKIKVVTV